MDKNAYLTYLLNRYRQNQRTPVKPADSGDSGGSDTLSNILKGVKYGRQGYKWYNRLFGEGTKSGAGGEAAPTTTEVPSWEATGTYTPASYGAAEGASSVGAGYMPTGTAAAGDVGLTGASTGASAYGSSGVGMTAGSWAAVAAPLLMTYLAYQAGSGVNQPIENRQETNESAKYIKDYITNKGAADPNQYNLPGLQSDDKAVKEKPLQYLYTMMHDMGRGSGKDINTGYNDQQIDDLIYKQGITPEELKAALGYDLPDWNQGDWQYWTKKNNPEPIFFG